MNLNLTAEARAALDLAKRAVPEGGELDAYTLLAALYHATSLKERLPALGPHLLPPATLRTQPLEKVKVDKVLQPLLTRLAGNSQEVTAERLFQAILGDPAVNQALRDRSVTQAEIDVATKSLARDESPSSASGASGRWRDSAQGREVLTALSTYGRVLTLTELPERGNYRMDEVIGSLVTTLSKMGNRSAVITGPSGVGKSAVVYEFARRIFRADESIPEYLHDTDIFELSPSFLKSGASMVGQYDERVKSLIELLRKNRKLVLFVDEIHSFFRSGMDYRDPFSDANESFKKSLTDGDFAIIGCTTSAEYRHYIEPDPALKSRLPEIRIHPPTSAEMFEILKSRRQRVQDYYRETFNRALRLSDDVLRRTVEVAEEYLPSLFEPRKSIQLLDAACARTIAARALQPEVTEECVLQALESMIGHRVARTEQIAETELKQRLKAKIIGQDAVLDDIAEAFLAGLGGWASGSKPRGTWFFCGPTGVGKTEVALLLAKILGGGRDALVRIDCNLLSGSGFDLGPVNNVLFGPPPGYLGYVRGKGGALSKVRDKPECVVLFDEIEKADPGVAELLLQIIDSGRVDDPEGNPLDFRRAFLIFTTNAGSVYGQKRRASFEDPPSADDEPQPVDAEAVRSALRSLGFVEEFLGRAGKNLFVFEALKRDGARRIAEVQLERLREAARDRGLRLEWDAAVIDRIAAAWNPRYGARYVQSLVHNRIVTRISLAQAQGELKEVAAIRLRVAGPAAPAGRVREGDVLTISVE